MKDPLTLDFSEWRGPRAVLADVPALSNYVLRVVEREAAGSAEARERLLSSCAATPWSAADMRAELSAMRADLSGDDTQKLAVALRRLRRRVLLALIARDITGRADLAEVVSTMTALAELAIQATVATHTHEMVALHGIPRGTEGVPQDLLVVAMGKLGGAELNVSSDIDLIFLYDEDGETRGTGAGRVLTNHEFFARLGRRVIASLNDLTEHGFVFRVDMRLRPNGNAGPLAMSTAMLEEYLMSQGREWERFAWLKSRVVSVPVLATPEQFDAQCATVSDIVRPFVFRKYLDFGAISALRQLHQQIRAEANRRQAARDNRIDDVKLGRGGIRELEFVAQTFQIIRGGREPRLRSRATLATLATLAELGLLPPQTCAQLSSGYVFLRNLEHALQYVDDAQTHALPINDPARERIARMLGAKSTETMLGQYRAVQALVTETFDSVFAEPEAHEDGAPLMLGAQTGGDDGALIDDLKARGFADATATARRLRTVLDARRVQSATESARIGLQRLLQRAMQAAIDQSRETGAAQDIGPDEHFARFASLADVIAGRSTYIALLNQYPQAFRRVMRMLAASRWATDYLVRHPILLDELLDDRLLEQEPDWSTWSSELRQRLMEASDDQEHQMNVLRDAHHAQVLRLLVADLDGRLTVERLADHLSALADATLQCALECVWRTLPRRHREVPCFAVIGYGKLGGKELGYESDLDLIFLYDDEDPAAPEVYATLARRLVTWLSTQTSSGKLFEIDLRLRPDGNAGLMVSPFDAFSRYQRNEGGGHRAWPWEHQALTRARFSAGDVALGERFEAERRYVLAMARSARELRADVIAMRQRMLEGHPNSTSLFDVKHDRGGMVDVEFIVQYLVLLYSREHPELLRNAGNIALLQMAGEFGLIDAQLAGEVADAYREFRRVQHRLRLNGAERARLPLSEVRAQVAAVIRLWKAVLERSDA